jgi:hypothetical protein
MVISLYMLASLTVFSLAIGPFLRDPSNPKTRIGSWLFLALAMALSPITLPNMLWQRYKASHPPKKSDSHSSGYIRYSSNL